MPFASSHNGGKSQINLGGIQANGDYPFINTMKSASAWTCAFSSDGVVPDPDILDINGYPTALTSGAGYDAHLFLPRQADRPGEYILEWDGNGTFADWTLSGITAGSLTSSTGSGSCRGTPYNTPEMILRITATSAAPNNIRNIRFYHVDDASDVAAGEIFGAKLRAKLREANPGVIRFMDWQNNNTNNAAKWADNKALTFYSYYATEYRGAAWGSNRWYFGATTNVGNAYSISTTRGRAPINGDVIQLKFNVDASATVTAAVSSGSNTVLTISTGATDTAFTAVGETVTVNGVTGAWSGMNGDWTVQARGAGSVTINFNSSSLGAGGLTGTVLLYHKTCLLNVDGSGSVNILDSYAQGLSVGGNSYPRALAYGVSGFANYATLVYNSLIPAWIKLGGDVAFPASGMNNAVPPQLGLQLAAELGAHPWFCMPIQSLDPMTDYVTQLATYCRDNAPSWMIPRFEPPNECFNNAGNFFNNGNCRARGAANGYAAAGPEDYVHEYGKFASTMGQDLNTVYGGDRTKYVFLAGQQTVNGSVSTTNGTNIMTSNAYVTQAAAAQSGYIKAAAKNYLHGLCVANYYAPSNYRDVQSASEASMAAAYVAGDTSQVAAYLALCYSASPDDGLNGFNLTRNQADFAGWAAAAVANGLYVLEFYEGGFSPDYVGGDPNGNALKLAARNHPNLGQIVKDDYAICTGASGNGLVARFPSHYYFSGNKWMHSGVSQSVWALLDDIYETPGSAQWQAIKTYNLPAKFVNLRLRLRA